MTPAETISKAMAENQDASISQVIRENGKKLFDFIRGRVSDEADAEDIFQDVMYELTESYRLLRPIEKMAAWLFRVARNKITDSYRKKKPYRLEDQLAFGNGDEDDSLGLQDLLSSSTPGPDREYDQSMLMTALEEALDELPPEQREVFIKHEIEGVSFNELVSQTGIPLNTLLSRKRYAVLHLRKKLQEFYEELLS